MVAQIFLVEQGSTQNVVLSIELDHLSVEGGSKLILKLPDPVSWIEFNAEYEIQLPPGIVGLSPDDTNGPLTWRFTASSYSLRPLVVQINDGVLLTDVPHGSSYTINAGKSYDPDETRRLKRLDQTWSCHDYSADYLEYKI
jgi:hypothetical protein